MLGPYRQARNAHQAVVVRTRPARLQLPFRADYFKCNKRNGSCNQPKIRRPHAHPRQTSRGAGLRECLTLRNSFRMKVRSGRRRNNPGGLRICIPCG